jgi:transposase
VITLPSIIYVATEPVNLHFSFDRLAGIVRERLGADPRGEAMFVFHNRRRTHLKILLHQERGYWLLYKRLDRGTYRIPLAIPPGAKSVTVSRRELEVLLRGIDGRLIQKARNSATQKRVRRHRKN